MHIRSSAMLVYTGLAPTVIQPATAGENAGWDYELTPYLLAAAMDGEVGLHGYTADQDASSSDIWANLRVGCGNGCDCADAQSAYFRAGFETLCWPWTGQCLSRIKQKMGAP